MVVMGLFLNFLLNFWTFTINGNIVSDLGLRKDFLFISSFTNRFRLFLVFHRDIPVIRLWRFRGVLRRLGRVRHLSPSRICKRARFGELFLDESLRVLNLLFDPFVFFWAKFPWLVVLSAG